jgi:hypothetical protein
MSKKLDTSVPSQPKKEETDYEAEGAMRTLMDAEKHKADPKMMKRVHAIAGRHMKALKAIKSTQDIRDIYNDKFGPKKNDSDLDE